MALETVYQPTNVQGATSADLPRVTAPVVPADTVAGRALLALIAIMTLLAALTFGAVVLMRSAANEWQSAVGREITIQIKPAEGRDVEADVQKAVAVAQAFPGVAEVRPYSRAESARLLEPWLGSGLGLEELPIPRLIVLRIAPDNAPDFERLRQRLAAEVAGASLDDHRGWVERMRSMARAVVAAGMTVLLLMLVATMLSVIFATRGAMSANRQVVEVLHVVGAKDAFIAGEFQRHFLMLGLKGGAIGGAVAVTFFLLAGLASDWFKGTAGEGQISILFGNFSLGPEGYGGLFGIVVLVAAVTAGTSRLAVRHMLRSLE